MICVSTSWYLEECLVHVHDRAVSEVGFHWACELLGVYRDETCTYIVPWRRCWTRVAIGGVRPLILDKSPSFTGRPSKRLVISYYSIYLFFICLRCEVSWFRAVLPSPPGLAVATGKGLLIRVAGRSLLLVFPVRYSARQWPRGTDPKHLERDPTNKPWTASLTTVDGWNPAPVDR